MKSALRIATVLIATVLAGGAFAKTTVNVLRVDPGDKEQAYNEQIAKAYEKQHPDVEVKFQYLANEAYKAKLPTLLQSNARPDIFYSWGGLNLAQQARAGFLKDISGDVDTSFLDRFPGAALDAYRVDGRLYGLPYYATEVVFWVDTKLTEKAGVDYKTIKTWSDFLDAVKKLKKADVTPIVVGGQDKWPLMFYWSYLALREGGAKAVVDAMDAKSDGFKAPPFVKAGKDLQKLADLKPFEDGFMGTTYETSSGMFADGKGAFYLMGDWDYEPMKERSSSGKGLPDSQLAIMNFPVVKDPVNAGGGGATLGGMNGWAVTKSASPEAIDFLKFYLNDAHQTELGKKGIVIPITKGSETSLSNPYFKKVASDIAGSSYHQIFLDQYLGPSVGATVNDVSADLAQGATTPQQAVDQIQESWDFR